MEESKIPDLTAKQHPFLLIVFELMTREPTYKHKRLDAENSADFFHDFRSFPNIIEKLRPTSIAREVFDQFLTIEASAIIAYSSFQSGEDPFALRQRLSTIYPTQEEIDILTKRKRGVEFLRTNPDFPSTNDVMVMRFLDAENEVVKRVQNIKEVQPADLGVLRGSDGIIRHIIGGKPFTGIAIERREPQFSRGSSLDALGRKPLHRTIEFIDGLKHGEEIDTSIAKRISIRQARLEVV